MAEPLRITITDAPVAITKRERTPEGFLQATAALTRAGVQRYSSEELGLPGPSREVGIYRPTDTVFADETRASARMKPVTVGHPAVDVTPANYRDLAVGHLGDEAFQIDDRRLGAALTLTDAEAISRVEGGNDQVSAGYYMSVLPECGTFDGQDYDYRMNGPMQINHVALVDQGRAGPSVRIFDEGANMKASDKLADVLTSVEKGHQHGVDVYDRHDGKIDFHVSYSSGPDEQGGHEHPIVRNAEGRYVLGTVAGHTHTIDQEAIARAVLALAAKTHDSKGGPDMDETKLKQMIADAVTAAMKGVDDANSADPVAIADAVAKAVAPAVTGAIKAADEARQTANKAADDKSATGEGLGPLLRNLRDRAKLTNDDLAAAAGISASAVASVMDGTIPQPPIEHLRGMADKLNVPTSRLVRAAEQSGGSRYGDAAFDTALQQDVRRAADDRARLIVDCTPLLGHDIDLHALSDRQILEAALKDSVPDSAARSDDYLRGVLDYALKSRDKAMERARTTAAQPGSRVAHNPMQARDQAYRNFIDGYNQPPDEQKPEGRVN